MSMNFNRLADVKTHIIQARKGETTDRKLDAALKAIDNLLLVIEPLEKDVGDPKAKK